MLLAGDRDTALAEAEHLHRKLDVTLGRIETLDGIIVDLRMQIADMNEPDALDPSR